MASRLDKRLEPGERVVYRSPSGRPVTRHYVILGLAVVLPSGLLVALTPTPAWVLYGALVGVAAPGLAAWLSLGAALVTERRLLYDRGVSATLWSWQRVIEVAHGEIVEIRVSRSFWLKGLSLRLADGRVLALPPLANHEAMAEALSAVTGLPLSTDDGPH